MTAISMAKAMTEIVRVFTDVYGVANVDLPNKPFSLPTDKGTPWARVRLEHTEMGQGSLSDEAGRKIYNREGFGLIELYSPLGVGLEGPVDAAEEIVKAYQAANTVSDVWFRNVRMIESDTRGTGVVNASAWYRTDITFDFQYHQIQ